MAVAKRKPAAPAGAPTEAPAPATLGELAVFLLSRATEAGPSGLIHVTASERRAERLATILRALAPEIEVLVLPAWDCLPYDRASPARDIMGRRMAVLRRLGEPGTRILLAAPDALLQRVPPRDACAGGAVELHVGASFDPEGFLADLERKGYVADERVDEPGEVAVLGQVVDVFPAAAPWPCRIEHADGRVTAMRRYDPVTQLTSDDVETLVVDPASEALIPAETERVAGMEHRLAELYGELDTMFDLLPEAAVVLDAGAQERLAAALEQIADAHESRTALRLRGDAAPQHAPAPERLYLDAAEWDARLAKRPVTRLIAPESGGDPAVPRFAAQTRANRAFATFLERERGAGRRIVLAAGTPADVKRLSRRAEQALGTTAASAADWAGVLRARKDAVLAIQADIDRGFVHDDSETTVVTAADLFGSDVEAASGAQPASPALALTETDFSIGDTVVHMDYGFGVLGGLEAVTAGGPEPVDTVRLTYKGDAKLLVAVDDLDRVWRYGSEANAVRLDRLDGDAWTKRRAEIEGEIDETARGLVARARERESQEAPGLVPPRAPYERFVGRFPFTPTVDQTRAIDDTLADLASGKPMDRLVCGDVGFGKTEIALRAAAAAALAGKQVAVVAPTTVLVRQHLQTFRRRFAGLGIEVGHLSRLVKPAEAKRVKEGIANGDVRIVVGTHAVAGRGVAFQDLGLVVIDEEQRFGAAHKAALRALAPAAHVLTLTATPIPRTLQAAMAGLQDLSVIATPPAQRRPIRTFLTPFDPASVRQALLRERRRGGQSFVVCPRIEDIEPMAARLAELVPELQVFVAHGKMPAEAIDDTMVRFADGEGDVLLATNIIESGLDVPRANTMLVWHADRFGLSQLHQLRGRVGRGRARGIAYLLTDPAHEIAPQTRERLRTLETLDRLGAGFAISARDLDQRGAGDLLGDEQAGHVKLIGSGLYQHLIERAIRVARGEPAQDWRPELKLDVSGRIPQAYIPEEEVRLNLYARLARAAADESITRLGEEIEDRFGPMPDEVATLLRLARLKKLAFRLGVARLDAGPQAIAVTFRNGAAERPAVAAAVAAGEGKIEWRGERLVAAWPSETPEERQGLAADLLERLEG
jgi:transcription-repair coupling factor (superfamily II helicase)